MAPASLLGRGLGSRACVSSCYDEAVTGGLLAARIEARRQRASERSSRIRARIPELAERLRGLGAAEVVLFGSLASGAEPHEDSDVDLAVRGMSQAAVELACLELGAWLGARVQLVRLEDASAELAGLVARFGQPLVPTS